MQSETVKLINGVFKTTTPGFPIRNLGNDTLTPCHSRLSADRQAIFKRESTFNLLQTKSLLLYVKILETNIFLFVFV